MTTEERMAFVFERTNRILEEGFSTRDPAYFSIVREIADWIARPQRGDAVEAWIKARRDEYAGSADQPSRWALDDLLDDYREHADTGTPLGEEVRGPHAEGQRNDDH